MDRSPPPKRGEKVALRVIPPSGWSQAEVLPNKLTITNDLSDDNRGVVLVNKRMRKLAA